MHKKQPALPRGSSMETVCIGSQWMAGKGEPIEIVSPADPLLKTFFHTASDIQVSTAVKTAASVQKSWAETPLDERILCLKAFGEQLTGSKPALARCIAEETGKPLNEANAEVDAMIGKITISMAAFRERTPDKMVGDLWLRHRPHGVFAVLGPYNFPGHLPNGHIVPALLAGNTVVFKPSEYTTKTAVTTLRIWQQTNLPEGVINLVAGDATVGRALIESPVQGILFTGSSSTGKAIHRSLAGKPHCLLALEMGGNNPFIIDSPVKDIPFATSQIIQGAFISAGQRCTNTRRLIIVEDNNTPALLETLINQAARLSVDHFDQHPFMGPVINRQTADRLLEAQKNLCTHGKPLLLMKRLKAGDCYLSPGIIDVTDHPAPPDEEWFGPLLQVYRVKHLDDAITLSNATRFGLAAGILSHSQKNRERFLAAIQAGVISINKPTAGASSSLPFGGLGDSGNHRPSAFYAADYCAWPQAITQQEG